MTVAVNISVASPKQLRDLVDAQTAMLEAARLVGARVQAGPDTPTSRHFDVQVPEAEAANFVAALRRNAGRTGFKTDIASAPTQVLTLTPA